MATLKAVKNNTAPAYDITCDREDGTIINLTGCTVTMKLFFNGAQTNTTSGHDACAIVDANKGIVSWQPKVGDLPNAGKYKGDVKVTYPDGSSETLYGQFKLKVRDTGDGA